MDRHHLKALVYGHFIASITAKDSIKFIHNAMGEEIISRKTVYCWYQEFQDGKCEFQDKSRSGRPKTGKSEENVAIVQGHILENRQITFDALEDLTGLCHGTIHNIIHDVLKVKKLKSVWIPYDLNQQQKEARVTWCKNMIQWFRDGTLRSTATIITGDETWLFFENIYPGNEKRWTFDDEDTPKKPKISKMTQNKRMYTIFFNSDGIVHCSYRPLKSTINAQVYIEILKNICDKTSDRFILHHDNASSHTCHQTNQFLKEKNIETSGHPPYSPDLAPCDFWLFPKLKKRFRGIQFMNEIDMETAVNNYLADLTSNDFKKCFEKWFERMHRCIESNGEYFETKKRVKPSN